MLRAKPVLLVLLPLILGGISSAALAGPTYGPLDVLRDVQDVVVFGRDEEGVPARGVTPEDLQIQYRESSKFYQYNRLYFEVAQAIVNNGYSASLQNLKARQLYADAAIQSRLPQVSREISIGDNGALFARVDVDQTIIGNGRFAAEELVLDAQELAALADFEIDANERIAIGLSIFLSAAHAKRRTLLSDDFVSLYGEFLRIADARVTGGVANRMEFRLFELKMAQAEAERSRYASEYFRFESELMALTGRDAAWIERIISAEDLWLTEVPEQPAFGVALTNTPRFRAVVARMQERIGLLEQEKAEYRPQLSVRGSVGSDTNFGAEGGQFATDLRLTLRINRPLNWGRNVRLGAFRAEVLSAEQEKLTEMRDINIQLRRLNAIVESNVSQLGVNKEVAALAEQRTLSFDRDFRAGAVGLAEAVSIIDTAKTVKFEVLDSLFAARSAQLEQAQLLGVLGPLAALGAGPVDQQSLLAQEY